MESIERISLIDAKSLDREFYFSSLIDEALSKGLLLDDDVERLQLECFALVAYKVQRYTGGESSSIRVELAASIMQSNLYTIGVYLKSFSIADDALEILKLKSLHEIYDCGRRRLDIKLKAAKQMHAMVLKNMLKTKNYTYNSTLVGGIQGFFKLYDPDYNSREIHITADYPIANPIEGLVGIEFIEKYLESIYYENIFCGCFLPQYIHDILLGYDKEYSELLINIFMQVLICAIGCILVKTDVHELCLSAVQVEELYKLFAKKSRDEIGKIIESAVASLIKSLEITRLPLQEYIKRAVPDIALDIFNATQIDKLEMVFVKAYKPN